jgi:hypothetical protein
VLVLTRDHVTEALDWIAHPSASLSARRPARVAAFFLTELLEPQAYYVEQRFRHSFVPYGLLDAARSLDLAVERYMLARPALERAVTAWRAALAEVAAADVEYPAKKGERELSLSRERTR